MGKTRVLLADRQRSLVEAVALTLDAEPGFVVVAVASHPEEALSAVQAQPIDLAVVAVDDPEGAFLAVSQRLRAVQPTLALVGVSARDDVELLARAVSLGYRGWVSKDVGIAEFINSLQGVSRGETRIPPVLLTFLLEYLLLRQDEQRAAEASTACLSRREKEVLAAMSGGATRQDIAERLGISPNTVRSHMQSILAKLDVHTSLEAITLARRALTH